MSINNKSKKRSLICGATALLFVFLTSAPSFGQSLAILGDKDAVGGGISHSFLDSFSSTTVSVGISSKKKSEFGFGYSFGGDANLFGFSMAAYPFGVNQPVGFGLLAGISSRIGDQDTSPIASLGFQTYLVQQTTNQYVLIGISRIFHKELQTSTEPDLITSTSISAELGLIHPTQLRPSIEFEITRFDPRIGTLYSFSLGFRIPFENKK